MRSRSVFVALGITLAFARIERAAHAQSLPGLPAVQDVSVEVGTTWNAGDSASWQDPGHMRSLSVEVGFLLQPSYSEWKACTPWYDADRARAAEQAKPSVATPTLDKYERTDTADATTETVVLTTKKPPVAKEITVCNRWLIEAFSGFAVEAASGHLGSSPLRANASLRETYLGAYFQYDVARNVSGYLGADVRLPSLSSGRAYDDAAHTAFKISGDGAGAGALLGLGLGPYFFVEGGLTWRYFPSIVVDPPSGVALPKNTPEALWITTLSLSVGATFEFSKPGGS